MAIPALALLAVFAVRSFATIFSGGGPLPNGSALGSDCYAYAEFTGTLAVRQEKFVNCVDGYLTCDLDRTCNGSCQFGAWVCTGQPGATQCTFPPSLERLHVSRRGPLEPPASLESSACGAFVDFAVPLKQGGRRRGRVRCAARATAPRGVKPRTDQDVFVFACLPCGASPSGAFVSE